MNMNKAEQVVYLYFYVNGSVSKSQVLLLPRGTSHAKIICTGSSGKSFDRGQFHTLGATSSREAIGSFSRNFKTCHEVDIISLVSLD